MGNPLLKDVKDAKSWAQEEMEWVRGGLTKQAETPTWLGKPTTQETVRSLENMWEKYDASLLCSHSSSGIHLESWTRCWARQMCGLAQSGHSNFTEDLPHTWRNLQHSDWVAPWKSHYWPQLEGMCKDWLAHFYLHLISFNLIKREKKITAMLSHVSINYFNKQTVVSWCLLISGVVLPRYKCTTSTGLDSIS